MSYFQFVDIPKCHKQNNFFNLNNSCCVSNQVKTNREKQTWKRNSQSFKILHKVCVTALSICNPTFINLKWQV